MERISFSHKTSIFAAITLLELLVLCHYLSKTGACLDREREALTSIRRALFDPSGLLSSWDNVDDDCCKWRGVSCGNSTGNVMKLDLHGNEALPVPSYLFGRIDPALVQLQHLQFLDLSHNDFSGSSIPEFLGSMNELRHLNLSSASFSGGIPHQIGKLSNLVSLQLSSNDGLSRPIPAALGGLSSLRMLDLSLNQLDGIIPESVGDLSSLEELNLQGNRLSGSVPTALGQLSNLKRLDMGANFLTGNVSGAHFENLRELKMLNLSDNPLILDLQTDWILPFQLQELHLRSVHIGPRFPLWLRTQKMIQDLDISNASIFDVIPTWFWAIGTSFVRLNLSHNMLFGQLPTSLEIKNLNFLDLSWNVLTGPIPCLSAPIIQLDLSNNQFSGSIPRNFNFPNLFFSASHNQISGTIPTSICEVSSLVVLDLSINNLSGIIPTTIGDCNVLEALDLSGNHLSGSIPSSLGSTVYLKTLHLSGNRLFGQLPFSMKNCTSLQMLNVCHNKLSGSIPSWIGESLAALKILRLRSNLFTGEIPPQLFHLASLQVFDVASNQLSGLIPPTIGNLKAMKNKILINNIFRYGERGGPSYYEYFNVSTKGQNLIYTTTVSLVICFDLSNNEFSGEIPEAITTLLGLHVLNLSGNHLTGKIPRNIGELVMLESLDFSMNGLSGNIPPSISSLTFLSYLNLSYNNLWGPIPSGNQIQTLIDPTIYLGNAGLCGPPLLDCDKNGAYDQGRDDHQDENDHPMLWFYGGMASGLVVGFLAICGILILKKSWRISYFRFVDDMEDAVYIVVVLWMAKLKQKMADKNKIRGP
ncbi:hypothetical protein ACLOJK_002129 [Asimina triloba]